MKLILNNHEVDIEPYYFDNNYVLTGVIAGGYDYQHYYTYKQQGTVVRVTELYQDIYLEHVADNSDWTSAWHTVAECKAQNPYTGDTEPETYILQERYTHIQGEDRLIIQYQGMNGTFYLPVYFPEYSPYQNILACGIIENRAVPDGSVLIDAFLWNPINKPLVEPTAQYRGGFTYAHWSTVGYNHVELIDCDASDLSRYPTPDPAIPLTGSWTRFNSLRCTAPMYSNSLLTWNGEVLKPLTPDDDINTPHTKQGPYTDYSDPVDFSSLPTIGPLDTGFIKAYVLTTAQCQAIADFMLTDDFIDNVKKLFLQPIDYIISLHFLPVTPTTTTATNVLIGGVDTEVSAPRTTDSYITFSAGSIDLEEFWASFLDYAPSTKIAIFLPFIGVRELNTDDVMTGTLTVHYNINVIDGDFVCELHSSTSHKLNGVINTFQGNMLLSTPVTQADYSNKITAGFTALSQGVMALGTGNAGAALGAISNAVQATTMKPDFGRSGNVSGGAGMLGGFTPYLIKVRPKQAVPKFYTKLFGKPSMIGGTVETFSGYTEFKRIDLSGITCTENERAEIEQLMKGGVFI